MDKTLTIFFSGTGHRMGDPTTLAALLHNHVETSDSQNTQGYDGCGVRYGAFWGGLFGSGIDKDCHEVIETISKEIQQGNTITLNVYGHSHGAIAALMLAKELGNVDPELVKINLALLDPVPGNFITTATLDTVEISLANKTRDLRGCKNLEHVLALYPYQPLTAHTPLFCLYPTRTQVEEDVIDGCHSTAQFQTLIGQDISFSEPSFISFARIINFMRAQGSQFKPFPQLKLNDEKIDDTEPATLDRIVLGVYNKINREFSQQDVTRSCHSATGISIRAKSNTTYQQSHDEESSPPYYNLHHQQLAGTAKDKETARITIEQSNGILAKIKRAILHYPKTWQTIKWTALGLGLTALFVGAGWVSASLVGAASLFYTALAISPFVTTAAALAWYNVFKPVIQWIVNSLYYPAYQQRNFTAPEAIAPISPSSSQVMLDRLSDGQPHDTSNSLSTAADLHDGSAISSSASAHADASMAQIESDESEASRRSTSPVAS